MGGGGTLKANPSSVEVPVERLGSLIDDRTMIDAIKIDVEGADTSVIMGVENLLINKQVKVLYYEQNKIRLKKLGIKEDEAVKYLSSVGYNAVPVTRSSEDIVDWVAKPKAN